MDATGRPSWAPAAPAGPATVRTGAGRPPRALVLAVAGVVVLTVAQVGLVTDRDDLRAGPRAVLVAVVVAQLAFAALALRRSPAAVVLLGLCLLSGGAGAVAGGEWPLAVFAVAVLALLGRSLRWFPGSQL